MVEKPTETVSNGLENGDPADDEGNEWQVCKYVVKLLYQSRKENIQINLVVSNFQLIGTKNKGTVTRSTDFGRTPVSDIFRGELRSRLQREGDHSTDVMQPFFTLQLNIEVSISFLILFITSHCLYSHCIANAISKYIESKFGERSFGKFRK